MREFNVINITGLTLGYKINQFFIRFYLNYLVIILLMQSSVIAPTSDQNSEYNISSRAQLKSLQPKKQQWAILYNQQAQQFKRLKIAQKMAEKQKQQKLQSQIVQQLQNKSQMKEIQKEKDKKFSEFIRQKDNQQAQRAKAQKLRRMLQIKRIDMQNYEKYLVEKQASAKVPEHYSTVGLDIGQRTKDQVKRENYYKHRQLTDALDRQLRMKNQQRENQKINEYKTNQANQRYLQNYYKRRDAIQPRRKQNQQVYYQFQKLNQQKILRQRQVQRRRIQQGMMKRKQQQIRRDEQKRMKKQYLANEVKRTLEDQVRYRSQQNLSEKKYNPQQNSYKILGGIFKDKRSSYDKKQYFDQLARQAQQQSLRKKKREFMTQQEYKLNMNQLNKAVNGNYAHDYYIDRTVNTIGNNKRGLSSMSMDVGYKKVNQQQDIIAVKQKLQQIRRNSNESPNALKNPFKSSNSSFQL